MVAGIVTLIYSALFLAGFAYWTGYFGSFDIDLGAIDLPTYFFLTDAIVVVLTTQYFAFVFVVPAVITVFLACLVGYVGKIKLTRP